MKTKFKTLDFLIILSSLFVTPAAFGQTTLIWTNLLMTAPGGYDIGYSTNWSGPAGPGANNPVSLATGEFNGSVPGPINVFNDIGNVDNNGGIGAVGGGFGSSGLSFYINSAQTSPVQISTHDSPTSAGMGFNTLNVDFGAGQLTLGDNSQNAWLVTCRPAGATHDFINNSTNPVIICPNVAWLGGGGSDFTIEFDSPIATPGSGLGDYGITNSLRTSTDGAGMFLWFVSSGTITWNGYSIANAQTGGNGIHSPIFLNACTTLILKTNSCFSTTPGTETQAIQNNNAFGFPPSPFIYDPATPADNNNTLNMQGVIGGGTSPLISISVWSGKLTLSGANLFTGDITNKGGELIAGRADNAGVSGPFGLYNPGNPVGQRGLIHLNGGTLGWSTNNAFDYSPRFATSPDPIYNFDSGLASVTLGTGLGGATSTLTKTGTGTITLSGTSSYGGLTTVSAGTLVFQGAKTGSGSVTVNDSATLEVNGNVAAMTPNTLTLGTSSDVTLNFDNVNSTANAPIQASTLSFPAGNTVHIVVNSFTVVVGQSYPLFSWTTGTPPGTHLDSLNGYLGNLSTNGNSIVLNITATGLTWTGNNNNSWDTTTANNWQQNGGAVVFAGGLATVFDDTTVNNLNITNKGVVAPGTWTVNNNTNVYQITSSPGNYVGGGTGLTKQGTNTLSLNGGANAYTGVTTISSGTVIVSALANGGLASDLGASVSNATSLVLDGGTLLYTNGTVQLDRLFTVTGNGGTIDASGVGALQFTNPAPLAMSGNLGRTLVLTGSAVTNNTMAPVIADGSGSATAVIKNGAGKWILTGTNSYSGGTTVSNGTLQVGDAANNGTTGSLGTGNTSLATGSTLLFSRNNSLTQGGNIIGGGALDVASGNITLTGNNGYTGGTSVSNGATLNIGNGGGGANIAAAAPVLNNGFMKFNSTTPVTIRGFFATISGAGNFEIAGTGVVGFLGAKLYTGWTLIDAGATLNVSIGNETTGMGGPNITNNGTLFAQRQDFGVFIITNNIVGSGKIVKDGVGGNNGDITLFGTNTYTGPTLLASGSIILGDNFTPGSGAISTLSTVIFTNSFMGFPGGRTLQFNRVDNFTFPNNILGACNDTGAGGRGALLQNGSNIVTLTGNNTYVDGTTVSNGWLVVGDGTAHGSIGTGGLKVQSVIIFNRPDLASIGGNITGTTGLVVQAGSGILTLNGTVNMYDDPNYPYSIGLGNYGTLVASNGTMVVTSGRVNGGVRLKGGAFASPAVGTIGVVSISNNLAMDSGTLVFSVNKSLAQSNTVYLVSSNATASGGTLQLVNYGPAYAIGDRFYLFANADGTHKPLSATGNLTVQSPGVTSWDVSRLGVDGSVAVTGTNLTATAMTWAGNNNNSWDLATANNWQQNGIPALFANGLVTVFDDSTVNNLNLTNSGLVQPLIVTVNNNANVFQISSSPGNAISGNSGLTKQGTNTLSLNGGANAYTGVTTISGGKIIVNTLANGGSASDLGAAGNSAANLVFDGGTLLYTNNTVNIDRLFTLTTNGGTIDASGVGGFGLTNGGALAYIGNGQRSLTLTGSDPGTNTFAPALADNGGATALTKNGTNTWILTGGNTYSGVTTINNGVLQIGAGGLNGSLGTGDIINNSVLVFNRTIFQSGVFVAGAISGTGSITILGIGLQNPSTDNVTLAGDNTYSGGTTITASRLIVGNGGATGKLNADSAITNNGALVFDSSGNFTLNGIISGTGSVAQYGAGTVTLNGNNTYTGGTAIYGGALQIGNGGTNGSIGTGPVTDNGTLIWNHSDAVTFPNVISGTGSLVKSGAGTLTLTPWNTYSGLTTVSDGTLVINGSNSAAVTFVKSGTLGGAGTLLGLVLLNPGTMLAPGASGGSLGTLTISNNLAIGGNVFIKVNKSLSPSNDFVVVSGALQNTGAGTLKVSNLGPALAAGDKFTLFSQPLQNGAAMTVVGAGTNWVNDLAVDGSISVIAVNPPALTFTNLGNGLQFSWETNFSNYKLQSQTNSLGSGIGPNWFDYPGGGTNLVTVPIDAANATVFFRLAPMGQSQGPNFVYDQQSVFDNTGGNALGATFENEQPFGQSFVPTHSSVGFIRLFLADPVFPNNVGANIHVNLWSGAIGTGTLLGSTADVFFPSGFDSWTNFVFTPAVTVTPGTTYYFQPVAEPGGDLMNVGLVTPGIVYPSGTSILNGNPDSLLDLWFREGTVAP